MRELPLSRPALPKAGDDSIDLIALIAILWRNRLYLIGSAILAGALASYYAYGIAVAQYRATAVLMLESRESRILDLQGVIGGLSGDSAVITSEVEVLKSRNLLGRVVTTLGLTADPEFNATLARPSLLDRLRPVPADGPSERDHHAAAIDALLARLTVENVRQSLVFRITVETTNPQKSATVADSIANTYIARQVDEKREATARATEWLGLRVSELQHELETAEEGLSDFNSQTILISPETLQNLRQQSKELRARVEEAEAALAASGLLSGSDEWRQAVRRINTLRDQQGELGARIDRQSVDLITLRQLTREAEAVRLLYEHFLGRLKETSAQEGLQTADSRILSPAVPPRSESSPRLGLIIGMAAFAGSLLTAMVVLLRDLLPRTFRSAREVEDSTGYPVLGQIPTLRGSRRKPPVAHLAARPASAAAEAVRNMRTSLLTSRPGHIPQVIAVTSALPGEGKTTLALALAQNLGGMGRSVLVIDADLRRRSMTRIVMGETDRGLVSVVTGCSDLESAVVTDGMLQADILPADQTWQSAADVFASGAMPALIATARNRYDHIVIDTPPVLVVPDARIISVVADDIVLAVRWNVTRRSQLEAALRQIEAAHLRVTGLVLTRISVRGMRRSGEADRSGTFSRYGEGYYAN